jgi:hypothetical protein
MTDRPTIDPESRHGLILKTLTDLFEQFRSLAPSPERLAEFQAMAAQFESAATRINRQLLIWGAAVAAWLRERPEQRTPTRPAKRKVGHPTIDDRSRLTRIKQLIANGKAKDRTEAIRILAEEEGVPEHQRKSYTVRLVKKSRPTD